MDNNIPIYACFYLELSIIHAILFLDENKDKSN